MAMNTRIQTPGELAAAASMTAGEYMLNAVDSIDRIFGKGYAKKNPGLVGDFMKTSGVDFLVCFIKQDLETIAICQAGQANALDNIAESLFTHVEALDNVADELAAIIDKLVRGVEE